MADLVRGAFLYDGNFICIPLDGGSLIDISPFDPPPPTPGTYPSPTLYPSTTLYPDDGV